MPVYKIVRTPEGRARLVASPMGHERPTEQDTVRKYLDEKAEAREADAKLALESVPAAPPSPPPPPAPTAAPPTTGGHVCPECGLRAATEAGLKSHLRARHGG